MLFSYNWLGDYIKGELPGPEELARRFPLHAFEIEGFKKKGDDFLLEVEITSNRVPDCASHMGLARECAAVFGLEFEKPSMDPEVKNGKAGSLEIEVKDKKACPRYMGAVLEEVEVGESPEWLKRRLELCGVQPVNNVVDVANFVMLETGQPLHAFDLDKLEQKKIVVRFAEKGERITTLDHQRVKLDKDILVIADAEKPVAIAGIKGGEGPRVDEKTRRVVLESANFDPVTIRKASQKTKIRTDASFRFEHGLDPNLAEQGIRRASYLMQKIGCAGAVSEKLDFYPEKRSPSVVSFEWESTGRILGMEIPQKEVTGILERLEFEIIDRSDKIVKVRVPTRRMDISIEEDLVEEVGRIHGYEDIEARLPRAAVAPPERNLNVFWEEVSKDVFKEAGFSEVYNYSFVSGKQADLFGVDRDLLVEIDNPLSKHYRYLAPSLCCNLVQNAKHNLKYYDEFRIFELGKRFRREKGGVKEERSLAGLMVDKKGTEEMFFEMKGGLENLFSRMLISDHWYDSVQPTPEGVGKKVWDTDRSAEIKMRGQEIGFIGFVSREVKTRMRISAEMVLFEIDFEKLQDLASEEHEYQPISPYPVATRDLALLVPLSTKVAEVLNIINSTGGEVVRDVDIFDIYMGEEIPEGKKNLAFHVFYQADDRTLSPEEIDEVQKKIMGRLEKEGWEIRK